MWEKDKNLNIAGESSFCKTGQNPIPSLERCKARPTKKTLVKRLSAILDSCNSSMNEEDLSFVDFIKTATNGKDVDVVLNSLAGNAILRGNI